MERAEIVRPSLSTDVHSQLRHIKDLSGQERAEFFNSFDTIFCDCDGVIWHKIRDAIPGSTEAVDYLQRQGKQVAFVTNNSIVSIQQQLSQFQHCNVKVEKRDIIHPAQTVCDYLKSINFEGLILCYATSSFKQLLRDEGFQLAEGTDRVIAESADELRNAIYSDEPVKAVVIDVDLNLTATKLMRAHMHLKKDPDCLFIGGAADSLIPFGKVDVIGPGPFISVVESTTKRKALILGKPGVDLCEILKQRFRITDPKRALFIGDSLTSDVRFGKMCGFQTVLVLTGGTSRADLQAELHEMETPDYIADSLGDLNGFL